MTVKMRLYASPRYLSQNGEPQTLDDLKKHRLICQNPKSAQVGAGLELVQNLIKYDLPSMLTVNNYFGVLQAVIHDLGIGVCQIMSHRTLTGYREFCTTLNLLRYLFI